MREVLRIILVVAVAAAMQSCSSMMSLSYGSGDLYQTDNRERIVAAAEAHAARMSQLEAEAQAFAAAAAEQGADYNAVNYNTIVADDYESAYARRLNGFQSPSYKMPSSYYSMSAQEAMYYASAYDPSFYNVMVSGDQVWVEPKYITSMFGSWGATNLTERRYNAPWLYGWSYRYDPYYYIWWGYPHYSWYDWNWTLCYSPFYFGWYWGPGYYPYGPGFYPGYPPHYHGGGHRPPHHIHHHSSGSRNNHGYNGTGSRYTLPTSNRNFGAASGSGGRNNVSGSTSSGIYNGSSNRSNRTSTTQNTRYNERSNTQNRETQRSSNYRQSTQRSTQKNTTIESNGTRLGSGSFNSGSSGSYGGGRVGGTTSTRR